MKCEKCGKELSEFDEDHLICNNEDCELNDKGWDRVVNKDRDD